MGSVLVKVCPWSPCAVHYKYDMDCDGYKTYDELLDINAARKKLNSRSHLDDTQILFCFPGTLVAACLVDWQFWTTLAIFWLGRWMVNNNMNPLPGLCGTALGMCASLMIFLLVFYVTTCYSRYLQQYDIATAIGGRIFDTCTLARAFMEKSAAWRLYRFVNAAHLLAYSGLGGSYDESNLFEPVNSKFQLLTNEEKDRLKEVNLTGGNCCREVLTWAMECISKEYVESSISNCQMKLFTREILGLRGFCARLFHYAELPVPFSYVQCINMMVFLFLPLFSYSVAYSYAERPVAGNHTTTSVIMYYKLKVSDSIVEFMYVMFFTATCLSLRTLGQKLQDPFGHNLEDLPVLGIVTATIAASGRVLCCSEPQCATIEQEANLFAKRDTLGKCFAFDSGVVGDGNAAILP